MKNRRHERFVRFSKFISVALIMLMIYGAAKSTPRSGEIGGWSAVIFFGYWFIIAVWKYSGLAARATRQAVQPIPTPAEIAAQFRQQYGRAPSFEELNAIDQMLRLAETRTPSKPVL